MADYAGSLVNANWAYSMLLQHRPQQTQRKTQQAKKIEIWADSGDREDPTNRDRGFGREFSLVGGGRLSSKNL